MKHFTLTGIIGIAVAITANSNDCDSRWFFSLSESQKLEYWWNKNDTSSLNEYARALMSQDHSQRAIAAAIQADLLFTTPGLTDANIAGIQSNLVQILSAVKPGARRTALTNWLDEIGFPLSPSNGISETDLQRIKTHHQEQLQRFGVHASTRLSRLYEDADRENMSSQISMAWRDPDPNALLALAEQRLAHDGADLAGMCAKLDYLVFQSFTTKDIKEIERLLAHLKARYEEKQLTDHGARVVQLWLRLALPAYEEALSILKRGNIQDIARMRASFCEAKKNGSLPSSELFRRLESSSAMR